MDECREARNVIGMLKSRWDSLRGAVTVDTTNAPVIKSIKSTQAGEEAVFHHCRY